MKPVVSTGPALATRFATLPTFRIRPFLSAAAGLVAVACGGGSSSDANPNPTAPSSSSGNAWSFSGSVVDTASHQSVPGAILTPSWNHSPVVSNAAGNYAFGSLRAAPPNPGKVTATADGFITREQWLPMQAEPRSGVMLDLIRNAAPFSMDFYKQMVRGTYDQEGAPFDVLRWPHAPKFYVRTVDQTGRALDADVVATILDAVTRAVPAYTGGQYTAVIETGTETRAAAAGWINVFVKTDLAERIMCGQAFVGKDPGEVTLINNNVCSCGSIRIPGQVVVHEVGHALGFFHVGDIKSVMYPREPGNCPIGDLSAVERYHAAIAYQRPRGNSDPDNDPATSRSLLPIRVNGPRDPVIN